MPGWSNKNCCCQGTGCDAGTVDICCRLFTRSDWAPTLTLYNNDPATICGYGSVRYRHTNACGRVSTEWMGVGLGCFPVVTVYWGIQADGTVSLTVDIETLFGFSYSHFTHTVTGLDLNTWYLSPVTFTVDGITYTVSPCAVSQDPWPMYPIADVYLAGSSSKSRTIGKSSGNVFCGTTCNLLNATSDGPIWSYNILTDTVGINYRTGVGTSVAFDDGNWPNSLPVSFADFFDPTETLTVYKVASCDTTQPPPCDGYSCYPDCLVTTCNGGATANASLLFWSITGPCACLGSGGFQDGEYTWDGDKYYSGIIGDPSATSCARLEIWYQCSGGSFVKRVRLVDINGNISDTTGAVSGGCIGVNFEDSFTLLSSIFTPLCGSFGTVTVDSYTNN